MNYSVLLVDDEPTVVESLKLLLDERGYHVECANRGDAAVELVSKNPYRYALIVLDYRLPDATGWEVIEKIRALGADSFILIYSGDESRSAVQATWKAGAVGFFEKGEPVSVLLETIQQWYRKYEDTIAAVSLSEGQSAEEALVRSVGMVGRSNNLVESASKVLRYRDSNQNVLISGETGTGKELIARALHLGDAKQFFAVNCAAYRGNTELLESELFGYEKGAFTGATRDRVGIFESAADGTVFLDEVHHLSLTAQAKLLRVCQERTIRRVGGTKEYAVRFRLVTAAKPDLEERCEKGEFLRDLFHRLSVLNIALSPLRDRPEDVEPLVAYFCRMAGKGNFRAKARTVTARTLKYLEAFHWPGNVRELENTLQQLLADSTAEKIGPEALDPKFFGANHATSMATSYEELKVRQFREQKDHISRVLRVSKSKSQAAQRLRISPTTLHSLMTRLKIADSGTAS